MLVHSQLLLVIPFLRYCDINAVYESEDIVEMLLWGTKLLLPLFL